MLEKKYVTETTFGHQNLKYLLSGHLLCFELIHIDMDHGT